MWFPVQTTGFSWIHLQWERKIKNPSKINSKEWKDKDSSRKEEEIVERAVLWDWNFLEEVKREIQIERWVPVQ